MFTVKSNSNKEVKMDCEKYCERCDVEVLLLDCGQCSSCEAIFCSDCCSLVRYAGSCPNCGENALRLISGYKGLNEMGEQEKAHEQFARGYVGRKRPLW